MEKDKLVLYECPWFAEFVSFSWGHTLIGYFLARKVNRKIKRYNARIARKAFLEKFKPMQ